MRNLDLSQLETQMVRGDVDQALITPPAAPPSFRTRHLFDERYVLIGRRNHPRLRAKISVEEFARLEHVIVSLRDRIGELKRIDPRLPVEDFTVGMVWHERSHGHSGQRWIRETIVALMN
jgi:DNA-binding transcriptional LysR family regulator